MVEKVIAFLDSCSSFCREDSRSFRVFYSIDIVFASLISCS